MSNRIMKQIFLSKQMTGTNQITNYHSSEGTGPDTRNEGTKAAAGSGLRKG